MVSSASLLGSTSNSAFWISRSPGRSWEAGCPAREGDEDILTSIPGDMALVVRKDLLWIDAVHSKRDEGMRSKEGDGQDVSMNLHASIVRTGTAMEMQLLRTDEDVRWSIRQMAKDGKLAKSSVRMILRDGACEDVGLTEKLRSFRIRWFPVHILGLAKLADGSVPQNADVVTKGKRFLLIMGDEDCSRMCCTQRCSDSSARCLTERGIKSSERLVKNDTRW